MKENKQYSKKKLYTNNKQPKQYTNNKQYSNNKNIFERRDAKILSDMSSEWWWCDVDGDGGDDGDNSDENYYDYEDNDVDDEDDSDDSDGYNIIIIWQQ